MDQQTSDRPNALARVVASRRWALAVTMAVVMLFLPTFINLGPPVGMDLPMWASVAHQLKEHVIPSTGWFWGIQVPQANAGQRLGNSYSTSLMLPWALAHVTTPGTAVKIACLLAGLVYALGVYCVCARFTPPLFAAAAAVLGTADPFWLIMDGMWYNILSLGLALWGWRALADYAESWRRCHWVQAVIFLAAAIYTHPLGVALMVIVWGTYLTVFLCRRERVGAWRVIAFLAVPLVAGLLAAPQLSTYLIRSRPQGFGPGYERTAWVLLQDPRGAISTILCCAEPRMFIVPIMTAVGAVFIRRVSWKWCWPVVVGIPLMVLVVIGVPEELLQKNLYAARFAHVLRVLYTLLIANGLAALYRAMRTCVSCGRARRYLVTGVFVSALGMVAATAGYRLLRDATCKPTFSSIKNEVTVRDLWWWLEQNVDSGQTRVYFEGTLNSYEIVSDSPLLLLAPGDRSSHILALTGLYTSIKQVNGWSGFGSSVFGTHYLADGGRFFGGRKPHEAAPELIDKNLRWLNCQYIVANSRAMKERLSDMPFLREVKQVEDFAIYRHTGMTPGWAFRMSDPDKRFPVESRRDGQEYVIRADGSKGNAVIVSVAYDGHWKAFADDRPLPIAEARALMKLQLPRSGRSEILLRYDIEKTGPLVCLGLGGLLLVGVLLGHRWRSACRA